MCDICNGMSFDEQFENIEEKIEEYGFTLMGVEAGPEHPPWIYTIGLVENHEHPELWMRDLSLDVAYELTDVIARRVAAGEQFAPGDDVFVDGLCVHVRPVGDELWNGNRFAMWHQYYGEWADVIAPAAPSALELYPCLRHSPPEPPRRPNDAMRMPPRGPNRATRRQLRRRRHRSRTGLGHDKDSGS